MPKADSLYVVCKALVYQAPPPDLRTLFNRIRTHVDHVTAYRHCRWLEHQGALARTGGAWHIDVRRLLDLLGAVHLRRAVPTTTLHTRLDLGALHKVLDEANVPHVFAYSTAAHLATAHEPLRYYQVIVPRQSSAQLRRLLPKGDRPVEVYEDRLDAVPVQRSADGFPVTELLRTAIDVRADPRGGAYAVLLQQAVEQEHPV